VLVQADCQSAIQPIDNRRYTVAQTGSLLYRRLLTGYGCATIGANFVNGPEGWLTSRSRVGTDRSANGTVATGWLSPDNLLGL